MAKVLKKLGKRIYEVKEKNVGIIYKKDIDQLVELPPPFHRKIAATDTTNGCKRSRLLDLTVDQPTEEERDDNPVEEPEQAADEEIQEVMPARRKRRRLPDLTVDQPIADEGDNNPVVRRKRPKRQCVEGSKNRYRESLLDAL